MRYYFMRVSFVQYVRKNNERKLSGGLRSYNIISFNLLQSIHVVTCFGLLFVIISMRSRRFDFYILSGFSFTVSS